MSKAVDRGGGSWLGILSGWLARRFSCGKRRLCATCNFVKTDSHGLAEVHGDVLLACGDMEQPVAVAEVVVGEAALFGAEEKRDAAAMATDEASSLVEAVQWLLQLASASSGGADDQSAVRNGCGEVGEFPGVGEEFGRANRRAGLAKCHGIGVDDAKIREVKVAHGAGNGADVERVARGDEHDGEAGSEGQGRIF